MKKFFLTSIMLSLLACSLGTSIVKAEEVIDEEQPRIEILTNKEIVQISFEDLSEETQSKIISEGIDISNTIFYKDSEETNIFPNIQSRAYYDTVLNYYFIDQTARFNSNNITQSSPYGHSYRTINVRNGYSYSNAYYFVKNKAITPYYRTDQLKVVRQYSVW